MANAIVKLTIKPYLMFLLAIGEFDAKQVGAPTVPSAVIWGSDEDLWCQKCVIVSHCVKKKENKNGQKVVKKVVKKLSNVVKKLSKSCQKVVKKLSKKCQKVVKKLSKKGYTIMIGSQKLGGSHKMSSKKLKIDY
jgi:hypothetical protein